MTDSLDSMGEIVQPAYMEKKKRGQSSIFQWSVFYYKVCSDYCLAEKCLSS